MQTDPTLRPLADIPRDEVQAAVIEMVKALKTHGSGQGFNIYGAVLGEWEKAIALKKKREEE